MSLKTSILVVSGDRAAAEGLAYDLECNGFSCQFVHTVHEAVNSIKISFFDVVIADVSSSDSSDILGIVERIKFNSPNTEIIVVDGSNSSDLAAEAINRGVFTYVPKLLLSVKYLQLLVPKILQEKQLRLQIERRSSQLSSLLSITEDMVTELDTNRLLRQVVKRALVLTGSEYGSLSLLENNRVVLREAWDGKEWKDLPCSVSTGKSDTSENSGEHKDPYPPDTTEPEFIPIPWLKSYTSVPVVGRKGDFLGIIEIGNKKEREFTQDDIQLLEGLARTASIGIENIRLYKNTKIQSEQLEESEKNCRILVEKSPDLIFIIENNKFMYANKKACQTLSYSFQEIQDLNIIDVTAPKYRKAFIENLQKIANGEGVSNYEIPLIRKDGEQVVLDVSSVVAEYEGRPAVQIIARDVTDRKKADEEILRLAAALKSLNPAVTITDMNRRIIYINPAHKKVFGYDLEELIGKQSSILYPFDEKIYEAVLMVGWEGERVGVRRNGQVFPVYEKTSVVKDKDGNQVGMVSVVEDITVRKGLEQKLRESEERYRTLVETAKSAIIAVNERGEVTLFNPAAEELFGYSREEMENKELTLLVPEKYWEAYKAGIKGYVETGVSDILGRTVEFVGLKKDGEEFPIEVSLSACKIGGRKIFTAIVFDITERKNLQEQLIHSEKMAALGQLISGVTHEINNPLAAIMGYAEMFLEEPNLDQQLRKGLQVIYDESNRAKKVIRNLLSFARKQGPNRELIVINEVLERTLNLKEYDFKKNNFEILKNLDPDLPLTLADPNQLQQVFLNLLINAEQALAASQDGFRRISVQSRVRNNGQYDMATPLGVRVIEISFSDNGPGISKKNITKIFDPFFTTKVVGEGTGLGLSVSYGIVKEHGGSIQALSEEGKGTTFIIELPIVNETNFPTS
ncbi:MAG TPA: PAS domain S-box protein [Thermodesulfobacteriota bacterium]|nr:PAS domain S-box protein [Thermodesulfobacteriota bacterium]